MIKYWSLSREADRDADYQITINVLHGWIRDR
jgi:hypothetical protein